MKFFKTFLFNCPTENNRHMTSMTKEIATEKS